MMACTEQVSRERVRQAFSAAAAYDDHAKVQQLTAAWLAERIAAAPMAEGARVCEIGCGTGFLSRELAQRISAAHVLATDISPEMVERARRRLRRDARFEFAVMDGERPDLLAAKAPFDVICSNLAVQWFADLRGSAARLYSHLKPGGRLLVTTLARGTFAEWRAAHADLGLEAGTPDYPSAEELLALAPSGSDAAVEVAPYLERFASGEDFLRSLRAIGAHTPSKGHRPLGLGQMRRVLRAFEAQGPQVTYEVALCSFRKPD